MARSTEAAEARDRSSGTRPRGVGRLSGLVLAMAAALLLSAARPLPVEAAPVKLVVAKVANDPALTMGDYGNELGIFQKLGLDVEIPRIIAAKMIQAMIGGSVDMALSSGVDLAFAAKGAPLKVVAALDGPPKLLVVVVAPNSKIKNVDDLKGHSIAISSKGSLTDWTARQIATIKGWPESAITRVAVGNTPARIAAMRSGAADGAVIDVASALQLEEKHQGRIVVNLGDLIKNFQNQVVLASDAVIKQKPEAVRKFLQGLFETLAYARTHKDQTIAFWQKELNVSASVAAKSYDLLEKPGFFSTDGRIDPATLKAMSKDFVELKLLPKEVDLSPYVDLQFLPKTSSSH